MAWSCDTCTYANDDARTVCEMCMSARPQGDVEMGYSVQSNVSQAFEIAQIMGCSEAHAQHALSITSTTDFAVEWIASNPEEPSRIDLTGSSPKKSTLGSPKVSELRRTFEETQKPQDEHKWEPVPPSQLEKLDAAVSRDVAQQRIRVAKEEERKRAERLQEMERRQEEEKRSITVIPVHEKRREAERQKKQERLKRMEHLKQLQQQEDAEAEARLSDRFKVEDSITTMVDALKHIKSRYGKRCLVSILTELSDLIQREIANQQPVFIQHDSTLYHHTVLPYQGTFAVLRLLGFRKDVETNDFILSGEHLGAGQLHIELQAFQRIIESKHSRLGELIDKHVRASSNNDRLDIFVFGLMSMERILSNILVNPTSKFTRTITLDSDLYLGSLKPNPMLVEFLDSIGFEIQGSSYICISVDQLRFERALADLHAAIQRVLPQLPLSTAVQAALEQNPRHEVKRVVKTLHKALLNVCREPLNHKYRRLILKKLLGPSFPKGLDILRSLDLNTEQEDGVHFATTPYPIPNGQLIHFEHRATQLHLILTEVLAD